MEIDTTPLPPLINNEDYIMKITVSIGRSKFTTDLDKQDAVNNPAVLVETVVALAREAAAQALAAGIADEDPEPAPEPKAVSKEK